MGPGGPKACFAPRRNGQISICKSITAFPPTATGGIYLRGRTELQLLDTDQPVPPEKASGAIFDQRPPSTDAANPPGEWNHLEIRLEGTRLTAWLNDQLIHDGIEIQAASPSPIPGALTDPGPIVLQSWDGSVWYKNIQLKPLPKTPARLAQLDEPEQPKWTALFNGKDFAGWQDMKDPARPITWQVQDEAIVTQGERQYIRTLREWTDFELEFEYKTSPECNGGIVLRGRAHFQVVGPEGDPRSEWGAGSIYGQHLARVPAAKPNGEWNQVRLEMTGDQLTAHLNGQLIHDAVKLTKQEGPSYLSGPVTAPGPIVLESYLGTVAYRHIRLRPHRR